MSGSHGKNAEPNLTPILDMVFQLITFFMLVVNFKSATLDLSLHLPAVGIARPTEMKNMDLLILNITREGVLRVMGHDWPDIPSFIGHEAHASLLAARRHNPDIQDGDDLPTLVIIRADGATPFKFVYTVINACQQSGFRQFSLRALRKEA